MARRWRPTTVLLFSATWLLVLVQSQSVDRGSPCESQPTCSSCLQTPRCAWCSTTESLRHRDINSRANEGAELLLILVQAGKYVVGGYLTENAPPLRCVSKEEFRKEGDRWCSSSKVVYHENQMTEIENRPLSSTKGREPVQVQPQRIHLRLKRGEEQRVILKYKQAKDYPVDLYYLMDLSASMEPYRNQLSNLGFQLVEKMQNLTSNFSIGFGSFVDKIALPMTSTQPDKLKIPCKLEISKKDCAPPYSFVNQMPLTNDAHKFKTEVFRAPVSGNLDLPEGGLEAMMQVIVCKQIGWRPKARHLIVFSTDASSHIAGDGRLAGVIEPNDCKCHLDENRVYNYYLEQDYPSISQINRKAREYNMNIIFAVPSTKKRIYSELSRRINGSSVGILQDNSENVIDLVKDEYEKLVSTVTLIDNAPKMIDIKYFSRCLNENGDLYLERNECEGLHKDNVVEFEIVLKVTECPTDPKEWKQLVNIKPRDLNESLTIDVEITCDCPCDRPGNPGYRPNATECSGSGTSVCGVCSCNPDFHGKRCECKANEVRDGNVISTVDCRPDNQTDVDCSGFGTCNCGLCQCEVRPESTERIYGKYCQCDNFSCKRSGGKLCGGRGTCDCGTCNCDPGWRGELCDCRDTDSTCIPPGNGNVEICSGHGDCICGSCHCREWNNTIRYSGQFCEKCPACPGQRCEEFKNCVECMVHRTGPLFKNGHCGFCSLDIDTVKVVEEDPLRDKETDARMCRELGDGGCTLVFKYHTVNNNRGDIKLYKIQAQKERSCPEPLNVLGVALGVVIGTVVIGFLILLIWKICTTVHDKREYARFEKERALAKWNRDENPLYKPATTTFSNIAYTENAN